MFHSTPPEIHAPIRPMNGGEALGAKFLNQRRRQERCHDDQPFRRLEAAHALKYFGEWFDAPANEIANIEPFKLAD